MRAQSGAKIQIESKEIEPHRQLRNVAISGTEEQRQWGNFLVMQAIQVGRQRRLSLYMSLSFCLSGCLAVFLSFCLSACLSFALCLSLLPHHLPRH